MYCALVFFATQDIVSAGFNDTPKPVGCQMCIGAEAKRRKIGFSYFFQTVIQFHLQAAWAVQAPQRPAGSGDSATLRFVANRPTDTGDPPGHHRSHNRSATACFT